MSGYDPIAPRMAQQQADADAVLGNQARQAYQNYTPPIYLQNGLDFQQPFQQGAQGVTSDLNGWASKTGYSGDLSGMISSGARTMELNRQNQAIGSSQDAFNQNRATQMRRTLGGFQKSNDIMGTDYRLSQLPQEAAMQWAQEGDQVKRMQQAMQAPMSPWAQATEAIGGVAGNYLGNYVGSRKRNNSVGYGNQDPLGMNYQFQMPQGGFNGVS